MLIIMHDMFLRTEHICDVHVDSYKCGLFGRNKWKVEVLYENHEGRQDLVYSANFKTEDEAVEYKDEIISQVKLQTEDMK